SIVSAWCDVFFFSSRRRHTRSYGDWSSDVCSSDLLESGPPVASGLILSFRTAEPFESARNPHSSRGDPPSGSFWLLSTPIPIARSEERRVGKECRCLRVSDHERKKCIVKNSSYL